MFGLQSQEMESVCFLAVRVCQVCGMWRGIDRCLRPVTFYPFQAAQPYINLIVLLVHIPGSDEVDIRVNNGLVYPPVHSKSRRNCLRISFLGLIRF